LIGAPALLLALGLGGGVLPVAEFDIPWFQAHPEIHEQTLRRCHQDYRLAETAECLNAEAAGTRRMGRPLPPLTEERKPAVRPPPATREKDRAD